ncbi:DegT/DnrJ/EryC1/StrS family aminotransferase [Cecembia lonarensis]|uniref:UDP-4-amino-4-deoxy-L-arabinose--oxoglutarate aminotransferase n=1 Tax=Cecembia lonarensis (strain CCUG 58316 / KCTC 22772 / LW9) TaxID=1225176 RepID=K1KYE6_CECL9|nr:DegT/DnrJ/EryC1/StrS family aminotransferase [Cecembia lonarensis]EKB49155.1 UDP-4-amino-4-deoxy-L-arabinose--oxoglutarate aminotransferase [Cecembia lonarensis LW9]
MKIPFLSFSGMHPDIKAKMYEAFSQFYDSNWYVLGEFTKSFEKAYAEWNQVNYCVGVSNGLDALVLSLKALGIEEGDEVLVPSNTYIATWLAVSYVGAKPVAVEPDIRTYNICPRMAEEAITPKTKAIMAVHLYGQACEMDAIKDLSKKHDLLIVEDNAQAHGATFLGKKTGSWGHINGTSFYPGKNLGALGEAGAVTTDNATLVHKVQVLRNYGSQKKYYNEVPGYNMRIDELQAALLGVKLPYLENWTMERQQIASLYCQQLQGIGDLILPYTLENASHVYHLYVVRTKQRDKLQEYLTQQGIGTMIHYPIPPHLQQAYASLGFQKGDFPIAEELAETSLSLPLWPGMTEGQVKEVTAAIVAFFNERG